MRKVKAVIRMLFVNWKVLFEFGIMYKILSILVFTPLFWLSFDGIMKLTGFSYLTKENIISFAGNPVTIVALLFLFVCMAAYSIFDIGAIIFILDQSYQNRKVDLMDTVNFSIKNATKVFHRKNIMVALVVLFMIPFLNMGVASSYISTIPIPEFIMDYIKGYWYLLFLFMVLMIGLGALLLQWLYAFHYFTLEDCGFKEARSKSRNLSSKNKIKDLTTLIGIQFICCIIYILFVLIGVLIVILMTEIFAKISLVSVVTISVVWAFIALSLIIFVAFGTPISYACISILFYAHKEKKQEKIVHIKLKDSKKNVGIRKKIRIAECMIFVIAIAGCSFYMYGVTTGKFSMNIEYLRTMAVTAHRGASAHYPENTMSAFKGAKELGANWIELDVQQSKDGQIVVMHDTNLKRTTGVDKNIWNMSYDEIKKLDVGSFFSKEYKGEQIPLLSEVIQYAKKNNMKLNIELKPTGNESNFEQNVIDIIEENQFEKDCVITSQEYSVLENVKAYNEKIVTVYVMSLAYGDINQLTAADNFSIEATSVTRKLVLEVHNQGKQLYAWTVNTEKNINKMIELRVDNIITDDITLAKECIYSSKTSNVVNEYVKMLLR
ncbi:MAG: glycerophosphodiester phosphodiesterase family protein [Cellulosilyticaceae bacterium]